MTRRNRSHAPAAHGKHHKRRAGVHKSARSPETERWNTEHLLPERPPWMPVDTYTQLATLRGSL